MTEAILLAAGYSSRTSDFKLLTEIGNIPVIQHALMSLSAICDRIYVVLGYRADELKIYVEDFPKAQIVINEKYDKGMFSSVKAGAEHIRAERFFVLPADTPFVSIKTYWALLAQQAKVVVPIYNGIKGHPVLLDYEIAGKIKDADEQHTLRDILRQYKAEIVEVNDPFIVKDIDTDEDIRSIRADIERIDR